ncbi:hypothetical protein Salat_0615500 [Sesamum alatum]|uniref:Uncharacterized protein n=1 Tax=Sesamum alatum TaxID=300844 RepID=A0AAE1YQZ2_9LAMI|nr:hypothetical protein Salat_0615500 [Sesamum alatum]
MEVMGQVSSTIQIEWAWVPSTDPPLFPTQAVRRSTTASVHLTNLNAMYYRFSRWVAKIKQHHTRRKPPHKHPINKINESWAIHVPSSDPIAMHTRRVHQTTQTEFWS